MSSNFKRYNKTIPKFLWDRPKRFIVHCQNKLRDAESYDNTAITICGVGKFYVRSFSNPDKNYEVFFGDDDHMPSCSCENWQRTAYPCKHFFAIFKRYREWKWENVTPIYRESPFLNIDPLGASDDQVHFTIEADTNDSGSGTYSLMIYDIATSLN